MAMLTLNGVVANCFDTPESNRAGVVRPAASRVQIHAENTLENGQKRLELVTLKVKDIKPYLELIGKAVRVPVGCFVASGAIMYYALSESPKS